MRLLAFQGARALNDPDW